MKKGLILVVVVLIIVLLVIVFNPRLEQEEVVNETKENESVSAPIEKETKPPIQIIEEDICDGLNQEVKDKVKELLDKGEDVVLKEGETIYEGDYVLLYHADGGRVFFLRRVENEAGSQNDIVIWMDIIDGWDYRGRAEVEGIGSVEGYDMTYYSSDYAALTWSNSKDESFEECF